MVTVFQLGCGVEELSGAVFTGSALYDEKRKPGNCKPKANEMRSTWLTYNGKQIFFQDFSGYSFMNMEPVMQELAEVQVIVCQSPENSVLVLADFRQTRISKDLMDLLIASSRITKSHIKRTAVLGIFGTKRVLADMLIRFTGQPLSFFESEDEAKDWLIQ